MPYKRGIRKANEPSTYGRDSVDWALRNGLLQKGDKHSLHLSKLCTQQEVIQYIYDLYLLLNKKG